MISSTLDWSAKHGSRAATPSRACGATKPETRMTINARGGVLVDTAPTARGGTSSELGLADVRRLQPLRATGDVEFERLALGKRLESVALDSGEVHKHILAVRLRNEA